MSWKILLLMAQPFVATDVLSSAQPEVLPYFSLVQQILDYSSLPLGTVVQANGQVSVPVQQADVNYIACDFVAPTLEAQTGNCTLTFYKKSKKIVTIPINFEGPNTPGIEIIQTGSLWQRLYSNTTSSCPWPAVEFNYIIKPPNLLTNQVFRLAWPIHFNCDTAVLNNSAQVSGGNNISYLASGLCALSL